MSECPACQTAVMANPVETTTDCHGVPRSYITCPSCGLLWLHPVPSPVELASYYEDSYYGESVTKFPVWIEKSIALFRGRRAKRIARRVGRRGARALDVGCGNGRFLHGLARLGFEIHGVELPGAAAERAKRIPDIHLHVGALDSLDEQPDSFDVITLWHVLEHMTNPIVTLQQCHSLLKADAFLWLDVPNGNSFQALWFGPNWFHRDPPRHIVQFTPESLTNILRLTGFDDIHIKARQEEMGLYGFLQSMSNVLFGPRDHLYNVLRMRGKTVGPVWKKAYAIILGVALFPVACMLFLLESLAGRAAVLRVVARKKVS